MTASSVLEAWSPVTHDFGLIRAALDTVVDAFVASYAEGGLMLDRRSVRGSLHERFGALAPLSQAFNRQLFLPSSTGWTGFFQNGITGSDPFLPMSRLSRRLDTTAMRVCLAPAGARYPSVIWEVYEPEARGGGRLGHRRVIAAANDGGRWVFHATGAPYAFERTDAYSARRVRDRFTAAMLADYLAEFGIAPLGDALFEGAGPGVLTGRRNIAGLPEFTRAEVLDGVPWQRG